MGYPQPPSRGMALASVEVPRGQCRGSTRDSHGGDPRSRARQWCHQPHRGEETLMSNSQPVIVLVHGAWADAASWNSVLSELQDGGFTVYAPPNPLRGLPQDSAYMHQFLTQNAALQGQPVVLVGHSYGGAVITNAAVGAPGVRAL